MENRISKVIVNKDQQIEYLKKQLEQEKGRANNLQAELDKEKGWWDKWMSNVENERINGWYNKETSEKIWEIYLQEPGVKFEIERERNWNSYLQRGGAKVDNYEESASISFTIEKVDIGPFSRMGKMWKLTENIKGATASLLVKSIYKYYRDK